MKISVIVTNYNQPLIKLLVTLESIIRQDIDEFEIIYADDCSENNYRFEVELYFKTHGFTKYKMACNKRNLGTVKNILSAAGKAEGKYVKVIGTGDLLYDSNELSNIYTFGESNDYNIFFGKVRTFYKNDGILLKGDYNAPSNPVDYCEGADCVALFNRQVQLGDWIPGGSLILTHDALIEYMKMLSEDYGIIYVEDFASSLALRSENVGFINSYVLWYEWGVGISNSGDEQSRKKMYADNARFYEGILRDDPANKLIKRASIIFRLKRFIALRLPRLYLLMQKSLTKRYCGKSHQLDSSYPDMFLASCSAAAADYLNKS